MTTETIISGLGVKTKTMDKLRTAKKKKKIDPNELRSADLGCISVCTLLSKP